MSDLGIEGMLREIWYEDVNRIQMAQYGAL